MNWIDIGCIEDIPVRGARLVKTRVGCVAVFRTDEAELFAAIGKALDRQALAGEHPVLLVTPELRRPLRRLLESSRPETAVLALREVDPKTAVRHLEEV